MYWAFSHQQRHVSAIAYGCRKESKLSILKSQKPVSMLNSQKQRKGVDRSGKRFRIDLSMFHIKVLKSIPS